MVPAPDRNALKHGPAAATGGRIDAIAIGATAILAALFLVWPVWRAGLPLEIWGNEGWHAFHADAARGVQPLYPPPDSLVANNYPPLSYLVIGALARRFGDALYVGRMVSLASTLWLGGATAVIVRLLGGSYAAATIGGLWFVATMARFFDFYVGMNEPQLLAQAVMATGLCWFLARHAAGRGVEPAVLVMVLAGFFKHNVVAIPLTALTWLAMHDLRRAARAAVVGGAAALAGLVVCAIVYGPNFVPDMLMPRTYYLHRALKAIGRLQFILPGVVIWAIWALRERATAAARFTALFIAVAFAVYLAQKAGAGVDENAQFELVFAAAIGVAMAFDRLAGVATSARLSAAAIRAVLVSVLLVRLLASTRLEFGFVLASPDYRALAADYSAVARAEAARVAAIATPVACSNLVVCRAAGKPFVYDPFKVEMMRETGASDDVIGEKIRALRIVFTTIDPRANASALFRRYPKD